MHFPDHPHDFVKAKRLLLNVKTHPKKARDRHLVDDALGLGMAPRYRLLCEALSYFLPTRGPSNRLDRMLDVVKRSRDAPDTKNARRWLDLDLTHKDPRTPNHAQASSELIEWAHSHLFDQMPETRLARLTDELRNLLREPHPPQGDSYDESYLSFYRGLVRVLRPRGNSCLLPGAKESPGNLVLTDERKKELSDVAKDILRGTTEITLLLGGAMPPWLITESLRYIIHTHLDPADTEYLYLPVSSYLTPHWHIDAHKVLFWLDAYLKDRSRQDLSEQIPDYNDTGWIRPTLDRVRSGLQRQRTIILFDGVGESPSADYPHLTEAITGNSIHRLIDQLLWPHFSVQDSDPPDGDRITYGIVRPTFLVGTTSTQTCTRLTEQTPRTKRRMLPRLPAENLDSVLKSQFASWRELSALAHGGHYEHYFFVVVDAMISLGGHDERRLSEMSRPEDAAAMFLSVLRERDIHLWLTIVFLSLVDDGVNKVRLARFIALWCSLREAGPACAEGLAPGSAPPSNEDSKAILGGLSRFQSQLPQIIVEGDPERIPGLEYAADSTSYLDQESAEIRNNRRSRRLWLADGGLKLLLRKSLDGSRLSKDMDSRHDIGLAHLIICEECLRQDAIVSRHAIWRSSESLLFYRRMLQGLRHGYESIIWGLPSEELRSYRKRLLPSDPSEMFARLYTIFYRGILEAPPRWRLARVLQAGNEKRELLKLTRQAWESVFPQAGPGSLLTVEASQQLVGDFILASARAELDTGMADEAKRLAEEFLKDNHAAAPAPAGLLYVRAQQRKRGSISKVLVDAAVHCDSLEDATAEAESWLKSLNLDKEVPGAASAMGAVYGVSRGLAQEMRGNSSGDGVQLLARRMRSIIEGSIGPENGRGPDTKVVEAVALGTSLVRACIARHCIPEAADLVFRVAEIMVRQLHIEDEPAREHEVPLLVEALACFRFAETLRRIHFLLRPLSGGNRLSSHPSRVLVRICLRLYEFQAQQGPRRLAWVDDYFFAEEARRYIDTLSQHSIDLPEEKARILILQSMYIRVVSGDLLRCFRVLHEADVYLVDGGSNARIRLQHLEERLETARCLLLSDEGDAQHRIQVRDLVAHDQARFDNLIRLLDYSRRPHWAYLRQRYEETLAASAQGIEGPTKDGRL